MGRRKSVQNKQKQNNNDDLEDGMTIDGEELEKANFFNYLDITLQTIRLSFRLQIRERAAARSYEVVQSKSTAGNHIWRGSNLGTPQGSRPKSNRKYKGKISQENTS